MQFIIKEKGRNAQLVYKVITPVAEMLWLNCAFAFEMYVLNLDNTTSQIKTLYDIQEAISIGLEIVIEVGWIPNP
jgi:hypothetical protein